MKKFIYTVLPVVICFLACLDLEAQSNVGLKHSKIAAAEYSEFNFEAARNHFLAAASFYGQDSLFVQQISSLLNAADCEMQMSHFNEAEKIIDTCYVISEKIENIKSDADILKLDKELAEKKCDYASVERILSELFNLYESTSDLNVKLDGFYVLARDAVRSHNYAFARMCADRYAELAQLVPGNKFEYYIACVLNFSVCRSCGDIECALHWALKKYEYLKQYTSDSFDIALALCDMMCVMPKARISTT